ncbi:MAG: hypothetical protein ACRC0R_02615, partial [Cetobacterium sp.]
MLMEVLRRIKSVDGSIDEAQTKKSSGARTEAQKEFDRKEIEAKIKRLEEEEKNKNRPITKKSGKASQSLLASMGISDEFDSEGRDRSMVVSDVKTFSRFTKELERVIKDLEKNKYSEDSRQDAYDDLMELCSDI